MNDYRTDLEVFQQCRHLVVGEWVSTPQQKCIGWPEQKYISHAGKKAPELGAFSSGIKASNSAQRF
jgi:hypothetical protein